MNHLLNVFSITNQDQLSLSYRLLEISKLPDGKTLYQNLQRVKNYVAREYGTPAVVINRNGLRHLAVALQMTKKPLPDELDVPILQGLSAHLHTLPEPLQIPNLANLSSDQKFVAEAFISFAFRGHLFKSIDLWQGASVYTYYTKRSINNSSRVPVALYPGFSFRVLTIPGDGLCVTADIVHVYTDTRTLAQRVDSGEDWRSLVGRHFVYEFGPQWYFIQLQELANFSVSDAQFEYPRGSKSLTNVYAHTIAASRDRNAHYTRDLRPDDQAIVYNYPGGSDQFQGAASLARLRYQTEETGKIHSLTVLEPSDRLERIQEIIADHFDRKAMLSGTPVQVSSQPLSVPVKFFPIPAQLFGNNQVLRLSGKGPDAIKDMWRTRVTWLRDKKIGSLIRDGITNQFILFPVSVATNESLLERIRKDLQTAINEVSPVSYNPTSVIWDDRQTSNALQLRKALAEPKQQMESSGTACAIVVLPLHWPPKQISKLRRHIKRMLYPIRTKCVQCTEIMDHLEPKDGNYVIKGDRGRDYQKYMFYTALDVLVTSGYWLWGLADSLHYDLYIGMDVLNNTAGFTYIGANSTICRFQPITSEQKEKLSTAQMHQQLVQNLGQLIPRIKEKTGTLPRHLVVHRDGQVFDTELEGLRQAVADLCNMGLLPNDVQVGVVEIHKSHADRLRLLTRLDDGRIVNPALGSHHVIDHQRGVLCTTGFPGLPRGTADAMVIELAEGDLDIVKVLQDVYWLSVLAWSKPDGIQHEPITIKLADDWLESIAAKVSDEEDLNRPIDTGDNSAIS